jgi:hypothetical protein
MPASTHNIDIKVTAKDDASAALGKTAGAVERLALQAKKLRLENRQAGENALEAMLKNPAELLNLGAKGVIADFAGQKFAGITDAFKKIATGEGNPADMVKNFAEGLPLIGEWVKGWGNIISLIDGSADRARELKEEMKSEAFTSEAMGRLSASHDFFKSAKATPYESRLDAIEKQYQSEIAKNTAARSKLTPTDEEVNNRIDEHVGRGSSAWMENSITGRFTEWMNQMVNGSGAQDVRTKWHNWAAGDIEEERRPQAATLDKANEQAAAGRNAAIQKLQIEEARRVEEAVRAINEKSLSMRLHAEEATAQTASQVWSVRLKQFSAEWASFNADIAAKFNAPGTSDKEKLALFQMMQAHNQAQPGIIQQASNDYFQGVKQHRDAVQGGLIGTGQQLLSNMQGMPGGNSWEAQKMQKYLQVVQFSRSTRSQIDSVLNDKDATQAQKDTAAGLGTSLSRYTDLATSDKELSRMNIPLQLAGAQEVGSNFGGAADALREQYAGEQAKGDEKVMKTSEDLLKKIYEVLAAGAKKDSSSTNSVKPLLDGSDLP